MGVGGIEGVAVGLTVGVGVTRGVDVEPGVGVEVGAPEGAMLGVGVGSVVRATGIVLLPLPQPTVKEQASKRAKRFIQPVMMACGVSTLPE